MGLRIARVVSLLNACEIAAEGRCLNPLLRRPIDAPKIAANGPHAGVAGCDGAVVRVYTLLIAGLLRKSEPRFRVIELSGLATVRRDNENMADTLIWLRDAGSRWWNGRRGDAPVREDSRGKSAEIEYGYADDRPVGNGLFASGAA